MSQIEEKEAVGSVDLSELLARIEYDRELLKELYEIFVEEFPLLQFSLLESIASGNLKNVQITAHTLKGMLASLSFWKASASASRIERMAAQSSIEGIPAEAARLERYAAAAEAELGAVCLEVVR